MKKKVINNILNEFVNYLKNNKHKTNGLFGGKLGISIFLLHSNSVLKDKQSQNLAYNYLAEEQEAIKSGLYLHGFSTEMSWFIWAMFMLDRSGFIEIDKEDYVDLLPFIDIQLTSNLNQSNYDSLYGNIALSHAHRSLVPLTVFFEKHLDFFEKTARRDGDDIMWNWKEKKLNENGYNLGLAHGMSGILLFLNQLFEIEKNERVIDLMKGTSRFLFGKIQEASSVGSYFPNFLVPSRDQILQYSRLAWCYGDLGVAFSLLKTARNLNDTKSYSLALKILKHSAKRENLQQAGIRDLGLCHGSSGLVLFFDEIFKFTKDPIFNLASNFWLDYTINEINEKGSVEDLINTELLGEEGVGGFLTGLSGVGLLLLTKIENRSSYWKECLLL